MLSVEVLQPLMVCTDVHLDTYLPISTLSEETHYCKEFFMMDWSIVLCGGKGFCGVLNWMYLLASVDNVVLRQDTSNCLIGGINFHDCLKVSVELVEDGS